MQPETATQTSKKVRTRGTSELYDMRPTSLERGVHARIEIFEKARRRPTSMVRV